jgi:hypothetical protein
MIFFVTNITLKRTCEMVQRKSKKYEEGNFDNNLHYERCLRCDDTRLFPIDSNPVKVKRYRGLEKMICF